ncbi:MAG: TetR/AcrR family transcriptional regulator [Ectothiorhodospiraceae bacterium]|nr:TetR/AcrR family transcriptional regulator [Ectothiorhodospiraceae bacterium]
MNDRTTPNTPPSTSTTAEASEETRGRILEAASQRFTQFGYNKTTMAEIAKDCDMSAANLYRFFKNKLDIGANLANSCLGAELDLIKSIVQKKQRPASDRLHDVVLQILNYVHGLWANDPRMNEMVNAICEARMDIVDQYKLTQHDLIVELLEDGVKRGEFSIDDVPDTAGAIISAITAFSMPLLMPLYTYDTFEKRAKSVVRLLLTGLMKR